MTTKHLKQTSPLAVRRFTKTNNLFFAKALAASGPCRIGKHPHRSPRSLHAGCATFCAAIREQSTNQNRRRRVWRPPRRQNGWSRSAAYSLAPVSDFCVVLAPAPPAFRATLTKPGKTPPTARCHRPRRTFISTEPGCLRDLPVTESGRSGRPTHCSQSFLAFPGTTTIRPVAKQPGFSLPLKEGSP